MRVLFTTTPGRGHWAAMTPLAEACRERGHDVLWATAPAACAQLRERGWDAVSAGLPAGATSKDLATAIPDVMALPPHQRLDGMFTHIFGPARAGPMLAELLPIVREWEPSMLVCDMVELAGPVAAAVAGVPNVTHAVAHPFPQTAIDRASAAMEALWEAQGLQPRPHAGIHEHLYVDIYPPSLAVSGHPPGTSVHAVRPAPVVTAAPEGGEPLVYVTFGTVFSRDLSAHRAVLDGIRDLPIRVLVTLGPGTDAAALGEQPPNVEVAEFVPQGEVLPRAAAVISHAGSGTFLAALATGVPQVLVPFGADQFQNADAGVAAGAAIRVDPDAFEPDTVRAALLRVLDDPAYSAAALRVREEIRAMPDHDEVVAELERRFAVGPSPLGRS